MSGNAAASFIVRRADWSQDASALQWIRLQVFVREQRVPESLEWDGLDDEAVHVIAEADDGEVIGTARLLPTGQIGRMAVVAGRRRHGVGTEMLRALLAIAGDADYPPLYLHAQIPVIPFYQKLGFVAEGAPFDEAGIEHRRMRLRDCDAEQAAPDAARPPETFAGSVRLDSDRLSAAAVQALAEQASRELLLQSADLKPTLYDQLPFVDAVRRLALARTGRVPVRILLADAGAAVRRGHRLLALARRISSDIQIRAVPEELAEDCEELLLADETGCFRHGRGTDAIVDFDDPAGSRALRARFEQMWEQASPHPELRQMPL